MSKFKAGDLALIVDCYRHTESLGKVVELIQLLMPGERFVDPDGKQRMLSESEGGAGWLVCGSDYRSYLGDRFGVCDEKHLMPLKGDFQPEQQKAKEVEA